jgi:dTDP-4-dehydrorhamnose reductase
LIKSKKIIAITGSTVSLGSVFVKKYKNYHYHKFRGDTKNYFSIKKWFTKINPEYFIYQTAIVPTEIVENNKESAYKTNVTETRNILKL